MSTDKWIRSRSGKAVQVLAIEPDQIVLEDIAFSLANKCRYTGHVSYYSVAEHSVKGSEVFLRIGRKDLALAFLFHDAAEAYLPDIAGPIKGRFFVRLLDGDMHSFDELEGYVLRQVARALGLSTAAPFDDPEVLTMDRNMLLAEKAALFPNDDHSWGLHGTPPPVTISNWPPEVARDAFMRLAEKLRGAVDPVPVGLSVTMTETGQRRAKRGRK